jgi:hypothetical protein
VPDEFTVHITFTFFSPQGPMSGIWRGNDLDDFMVHAAKSGLVLNSIFNISKEAFAKIAEFQATQQARRIITPSKN